MVFACVGQNIRSLPRLFIVSSRRLFTTWAVLAQALHEREKWGLSPLWKSGLVSQPPLFAHIITTLGHIPDMVKFTS